MRSMAAAEAAMRCLQPPHEATNHGSSAGRFALKHHISNAVRRGVELAWDRHWVLLAEDRIPTCVERADFTALGIVVRQREDAEEADDRAASEDDLGQSRAHDRVYCRAALAKCLFAHTCRQAV